MVWLGFGIHSFGFACFLNELETTVAPASTFFDSAFAAAWLLTATPSLAAGPLLGDFFAAGPLLGDFFWINLLNAAFALFIFDTICGAFDFASGPAGFAFDLDSAGSALDLGASVAFAFALGCGTLGVGFSSDVGFDFDAFGGSSFGAADGVRGGGGARRILREANVTHSSHLGAQPLKRTLMAVSVLLSHLSSLISTTFPSVHTCGITGRIAQ